MGNGGLPAPRRTGGRAVLRRPTRRAWGEEFLPVLEALGAFREAVPKPPVVAEQTSTSTSTSAEGDLLDLKVAAIREHESQVAGLASRCSVRIAGQRAMARESFRLAESRLDMSGWFGLLGSGEFQAWSHDVDSWLLERVTGDGRVLVLPTASAPEGDEVFSGWADHGLSTSASVGVTVEVLEVRDRTDADDARWPSGSVARRSSTSRAGTPPTWRASLRNTALWRAVVDGLDRGMGYIGCSAGMACSGSQGSRQQC